MAINPDHYTTAENVPLFVDIADGVLANDSEPNGPLEVIDADSDATTDQGFQIKISSNGSLEYLPGPGFSGTDTFTYTVQDQHGTQFTGQLTINVTATAAQPELNMTDASLTGLTAVGPDQTVAIPGTILEAMPVAFAALSNGGFALGAMAHTDNLHVFIQVYGADGLAVDSPIQIQSTEPIDNLSLASLPGGGFLAAWHPGGVVQDQPIGLELFDNSGTPVGSPISLGDGATVRGQVSLTPLSNGNVAVTWADTGDGLLVQIVEPNGTFLGTPTVLEPPGDPRSMSAITPDVNGGFIVAWRLNDSGNSSVSAQRYNANGVAVGSPILVTGPESSTEIVTPTIAGLANGGFAVTWADFEHSSSVLTVHSQAFGADNQPAGPEFSSAQTFNGTLFGTLRPRITELAHGYVVSWEAGAEPWADLTAFNGPSPTRMANYFQVFDDNGNALSGAVLAHVAQASTDAGVTRTVPVVTPLPDGGFAMRFENYAPGPDPHLHTVIQLFDAHGDRVGNEALASQSASTTQVVAMLGVLNNGELVAAYAQSDSVTNSLHVQNLDLTTSLSVVQDGSPITVPISIKTNGVGDSETVTRVVISGLPDGTLLTPPPGVSATFDPATHLWTLAGTIPAELSVTLKLPAGYAGSLDLLATAFVKDVGAATETASAPLSIPINVILTHGETIVVPRGHHLIDATHTVAGQPLPTALGDLIISHGGSNTIYGGGGNDTIVAGPGHDHLFGGPGRDIFLFRGLVGDTHIGDFTHRQDKLEFAKSVFLSAAHIHYDAATGALIFNSMTGWNQPVHFATLAPHLHITHADFLFV